MGHAGTDEITYRYILLTDIVSSSRLMEQYPQEFNALLDRHNQLFLTTAGDFGGEIFKNTGDGYYVFFRTARECIVYAHELARQFARFPVVADGEPFAVRIALHAGEIRPSVAQYFGPALNRASRLCQVCHPGQVLISDKSYADNKELPDGFTLIDLGEHYLRDLEQPEHLYQLDCDDLAAREFPPLPTLNNRPHNLWQHNDSFIGRKHELAELTGMLREGQRLITIAGLGGYGKSRLSRHLLADLLPEYNHGVYVVELEPLNSEDEIVSATARALKFNFFDKRSPEEQLISFLRNKQLLLCFDNFEHILDGRELVAAILKGAPDVRVMVTTREPLHIKGEQVYQLDPLPISSSASAPACAEEPAASTVARSTDCVDELYADAVLLFADRAALVNPGFSLTAENADEVAAICRTLSGIPLATELAAAWMDSFTLSELHEELAEQLELESRFEDVPGRHKSLRASLDWSWNLLTDEQRETLMRMATFKGGAFADAAEAVLGLKGMKLRKSLATLMDKSWLSTRGSAAAAATGWVGKTQELGQTRWYMRDAASREYAFEKLEGTKDRPVAQAALPADSAERQAQRPAPPEQSLYESAVMAHARFFSDWVAEQGPRLHGDGTPTGQLEALKSFEVELENILEATDSLLARLSPKPLEPAPLNLEPSSLLLPIARWLLEFYQAKGKAREQHAAYSRLFTGVPAASSAELRFWAEYGLGYACWRLGLMDQAIGHAEACMELVNDSKQDAYPTGGTGFQPVMELKDDRQDAGPTKQNAGPTKQDARPTKQDARPTKPSLEPSPLNLEPNIPLLRANALNLLGNLHSDQGRVDQARECFEASLAIFRELGDRRGESSALNNLGFLHRTQGRMEEARHCYETALAIRRELGDRRGESLALNNLGFLHRTQGRMEEARQCYETALAIRRELGDRRGESSALNNLGNLHCDQGRMDETLECYEAALAIYRELGDRQGEGVLLGNLGQLHSDLGWMEKARECFEGSLMIARELGNLLSEGWTRADYADHLLKTSEWVSARKMLEQSQQISEELSMKDCLACLHPKWARYWLLVHEEQSFGEGFQPAKQEGWQDASPTGEDTPAKPQAALDKALHHLDVAKGYLADIGGTWETEFGQEITKARRTILEFAAKYGLSEQVTDLAAEQTAEDELREQDEAAG